METPAIVTGITKEIEQMTTTTSSQTKTCTNKGCGKTFTDDENRADSCRYHIKPPVFHEGLKGWGCCPKKAVTFDEFLEIPGCATGPHSDKKEEIVSNSASQSATAQPSSEATEKPPKTETFQTSGSTNIFAPVKPVAPAAKPEPRVFEEINDPDDATIPDDSACKRHGCSYKFKSAELSRGEGAESECNYHPGDAVFHEGSKGWSCCSRKVLEFEEFLKIEGCRKGKHLFVGKGEEYVECRRDWFQSPSTISLSIYAKKVDPFQVKITFQEQRMEVDIVLPTQQKHRYHTDLFQPILPEKCSYRVLGTKIEITLHKANGISWPSIEPTSEVKTWTTFGISGKTGTVGGKEMMLSNDSPLLVLPSQK